MSTQLLNAPFLEKMKRGACVKSDCCYAFSMYKNIQVGVGLFVSVALNVFSLSAHADQSAISVDQIQKAINLRKAGWVAKENWVTKLPRAEIKRMMGVQEAPDLAAEFIVPPGTPQPFLNKAKLPAALDWRNKDGVNWVSPILNQGNCGSCVAFSTVATLETQVNVSSGIPGLNPQFSTQSLFACGGGACDFGWQPQLAAQYLQKTGVPDEACNPYTMGATGVDVDCSAQCADHDARTLKIVSFTTPSTGQANIDAVKAALQDGPLTTTLMVYDDFLFYSGGVYKHVTGGLAGGHAVSLVGYSDADHAWIIRNSWGADWGENGYIRVSYDDTSGISNSTWGYVIPKADGYVTLYSPLNRAFVSGTAHVQAESTFAGTQKVTVNVNNQQGRSVYSNSCLTKACSLDMDTSKLPDGVYDSVAVATIGSRTEQSQHEIFYIVNNAPAMTLSFTGQDVDLSKPLQDRVVFNVDAKAGAVPFSSVQFHVVQNGKEVYSKSANIVVPGMTLGWRTGSVPNGSYEIYFTGAITPEGGKAYQTESPHMTVSVNNPSGS